MLWSRGTEQQASGSWRTLLVQQLCNLPLSCCRPFQGIMSWLLRKWSAGPQHLSLKHGYGADEGRAEACSVPQA